MAGARAVEEILDRGGGEQFRITMFGDEPYGNYNRIMLCHVLAGRRGRDGDLPQPARLVRRERHHAARRRAGRADRPLREARSSATTAPSRRLRQADHRHRQPHVLPADGRHVGRRQDAHPGRVRVPHPRRHHGDARLRRSGPHAPSSSAAGCSGWRRPTGCSSTGSTVHVVQAGPVLMNQQLDEEAGAILRRGARARLGITCTPGKRTDRDPQRAGRWPGVVFERRQRPSTPTWSWSPPASGPTSGSASCPG